MNHHKGKFHINFLPIIVWMAAIGALVSLYSYQSESFQQIGMAQNQKSTILAFDTGVLLNYNNSLAVKELQYVKKGQILALFDVNTDAERKYNQTLLELRKNTALAELEKIKADLIAAGQRLQMDYQQNQQSQQYRYGQLLLDGEQARLELLQIQAELEPDKILLEDLKLETELLQDLYQQQAIEEYELQKIKVQYQALAKKIEINQEKLQLAQIQLLNLLQRIENFDTAVLDASTEFMQPLRLAIDVQYQKIAELIMPETTVPIRAPFDGIISKIYHFPDTGQTIARNEAIMEITATNPSEVIFWLNQNQLGMVQEGMPVEVIKTSPPKIIFASQIKTLSPALELMPEHLWDSPNMPKWGWPAIVPIQADIMKLTPAETVGIRRIN